MRRSRAGPATATEPTAKATHLDHLPEFANKVDETSHKEPETVPLSGFDVRLEGDYGGEVFSFGPLGIVVQLNIRTSRQLDGRPVLENHLLGLWRPWAAALHACVRVGCLTIEALGL